MRNEKIIEARKLLKKLIRKTKGIPKIKLKHLRSFLVHVDRVEELSFDHSCTSGLSVSIGAFCKSTWTTKAITINHLTSHEADKLAVVFNLLNEATA